MDDFPSATDHVRLHKASTFESIECVVERAQAFAETHFDDDEAAYGFVLATSEAVTNGVKHGNKSDPDKMITVDFLAFADRIEAAVADEGEGYDRAQIDDPLDEDNLTRAHGRGVFLIERLADEVILEDEGRRVRIVMKRA